MVQANKKELDIKSLNGYIPEEYMVKLLGFMDGKKFGTFSFIIQNGRITGIDILEKSRLADRKTEAKRAE